MPRRASRAGTEKTTPHRPSPEVRPWMAGAPTAKDVGGRCRTRQDESRHHVSPTHCPQALGMAQRQFKRGHHNSAEDTETIQGFRAEGRSKSSCVTPDTPATAGSTAQLVQQAVPKSLKMPTRRTRKIVVEEARKHARTFTVEEYRGVGLLP
jgi:hypothetical protein